jgi:DNA-binding HxlR family transcriptional regulator
MKRTRGIAPDAFLLACPSRAVLTRIGEKWAMLALVALTQGPRRFGGLRRSIEGVSQKMLTQTLRNLERDGLVTRRLYDEMPLRVEYELTALGKELVPLVACLKAWAEQNLRKIEKSQTQFENRRGT